VSVDGQAGIAPWDWTLRRTYYPGTIGIETAKPLVVTAGRPVRVDLQILQRTGVHVAGRLLTPQGSDYPAGSSIYTNVALFPEPHDMFNRNGPSAVGQTGDYEVKNVLPGRYTVVASTRERLVGGFEQKEVFGLVRSISVGDRDLDDVDLTLAPLRDAAGQVTFREGCPPAAVRISAQTQASVGLGQAEAVAESDGQFVLHNLTAGRYMLSIHSASEPLIEEPVESIAHGNRNVLQDGFESPFAGDEPIRITLGCRNPGSSQ